LQIAFANAAEAIWVVCDWFSSSLNATFFRGHNVKTYNFYEQYGQSSQLFPGFAVPKKSIRINFRAQLKRRVFIGLLLMTVLNVNEGGGMWNVGVSLQALPPLLSPIPSPRAGYAGYCTGNFMPFINVAVHVALLV